MMTAFAVEFPRVDDKPIDDLHLARRCAAGNADDAKRIMLARLLRELPEQRRTVFVLFEIEGFSHAEIATIAGISEANSKWILFSTKRQLQEKWKHEH